MDIIEKIAADLKLDKTYVSEIAKYASSRYKEYSIPKRSKGLRYIAQPSPELKTLQYWIVDNIISKLPVSSFACAYKKGDSIKKHALLHKMSRFMLYADIRNFFPSIHPDLLQTVLITNKAIFDDLDLDFADSITDISNICFRNNALTIGAVSSPAISNAVMYEFDIALSNFCEKNNYVYSRYADDIYISSKTFIDASIVDVLKKELEKYSFKLNTDKTRFLSRKYQRRVTGIVITDSSEISIGTQRRNLIKKYVYNKLVHGKGDSEQILGYLSFLKDIEPKTYNNIIIKYSRYCNGDIFEAIKNNSPKNSQHAYSIPTIRIK